MKSHLTAVLMLALFSGNASSTFIGKPPSLDDRILNSDSVITAQIVSGKCMLADCKESKPHISYKEYVIKCTSSIAGQCPQRTHFRSASELKVGAMYILIMYPDKDGLPAISNSLELQNENREVIFEGTIIGLRNITMYKRTSRFEPKTVKYYYRYNDFVSAVTFIKNDPRFKN